jgi:hypothetical protein
MFAILSLGFRLGMQHALQADHIAAVSSIAARRSDVTDIVKPTVIAVPIAISARFLTLANHVLQGAVGLVTVAIGLNTIVATAFA